jgi:aryl-alcohol dehydrogenase-like predicted oxidoreductase
MQTQIGQSTVNVSSIGLGAMPLSVDGRPSEEEAFKVIKAALEAGVDFIDTADAYCLDDSEVGHNERLVSLALERLGVQTEVRVATKGACIRPGGAWLVDGSPTHLRKACEASLRNLKTESIFLYQLHSVDLQVPLVDSIAELCRLQQEGKIQHIGISNVSQSNLKTAMSVTTIASVQNRFNVFSKLDLDNGLIGFCKDNSITYIPHSPVGGFRSHREITRNQLLQQLSAKYQVSPYRIMLAWILAIGEHLLPIPGASRPESILDSSRAIDLSLNEEDLQLLDAISE